MYLIDVTRKICAPNSTVTQVQTFKTISSVQLIYSSMLSFYDTVQGGVLNLFIVDLEVFSSLPQDLVGAYNWLLGRYGRMKLSSRYVVIIVLSVLTTQLLW